MKIRAKKFLFGLFILLYGLGFAVLALTGPDGSTWTVKPDIFAKTYGEVTPGSGVYEKTALARAMKLKVDYSVQSLEGASSGKAGDCLIMGPNNEFYIVNAAKFEGMYTQVQQPAKN